jgi:hypothetical protein
VDVHRIGRNNAHAGNDLRLIMAASPEDGWPAGIPAHIYPVEVMVLRCAAMDTAQQGLELLSVISSRSWRNSKKANVMQKFSRVFLMLLACAAAVAAPATARAQVEDLVGTLTSDLGVTEEQAMGGSGAIFELAESRLAPEEWSTVSESVPGVQDLMAAAPEVETGAGMPGGALGESLGGALGESGAGDLMGAGDLGGLAALAGPFNELGMSPDMIGEFVPVVFDYVQSTGGDAVTGLLRSALLGG